MFSDIILTVSPDGVCLDTPATDSELHPTRYNWDVSDDSETWILNLHAELLRKGCFGNFCHRRFVPSLLHAHSSPQGLTPPSATGFSQAFPGITPHLLTLETNFRTPFYRDILMWMGVCSVSKESCHNILGQGSGSAITIVVGGAAESLSARPGTADLTLRKRYEASGSNILHLFLRPIPSDLDSSRLPFERGTLREWRLSHS